MLMRPLQASYSAYFNMRNLKSGHLWEGRYFSCPLDEAHLWAAVRYVAMNPVRAEIVDHAWEYQYSSAPAHCGLTEDALLDADFPPEGVIDDWKQWHEFDNREAEMKLKLLTESGRPAGSKSFSEKIVKILNRKILPNKRGRPKTK